MRKVGLLLFVSAFLFGCTFPEQYKESTDVKLDSKQTKVLSMSDEEFLQHAQKQDPQFRNSVDALNQTEAKKDEIIRVQEAQDEELRQLVESEATKKAVLINTMADLDETNELVDEGVAEAEITEPDETEY